MVNDEPEADDLLAAELATFQEQEEELQEAAASKSPTSGARRSRLVASQALRMVKMSALRTEQRRANRDTCMRAYIRKVGKVFANLRILAPS